MSILVEDTAKSITSAARGSDRARSPRQQAEGMTSRPFGTALGRTQCGIKQARTIEALQRTTDA